MNEQQAKALFFSQYYGQAIEYDRDKAYDGEVFTITGYAIDCANKMDKYLLLRSVSQLTDEEKTQASKIVEPFEGLSGWWKPEHGERWVNQSVLGVAVPNAIILADYMRSIGILLPFTYLDETNKPITLSPSDIIKKGWVQIKER